MTVQRRYHLITGGQAMDEPSSAGPHAARRGLPVHGERPKVASSHYREELTAAAVAIMQAMALGAPNSESAALLDEAARCLGRAKAAVPAVARGTG